MTPFVSFYTSFGQPPSQASRREPWGQEWSFGPTSIKNDNLNNYGLSNKKQSTCFSFIFFLLSSTQVEIIVAFHPTIHNCFSLRAEIWSRSMFRTAKKSTDSRIFMAMRPVGPASVHKVRLLPRTQTLSFLLPMAPCASSPVTRVWLAFCARLCAKNEAPEAEETDKAAFI